MARVTIGSIDMNVRIEDVARVAGVSMKTVSRVLNNEPNVKEHTRQRVQAAVAKLNYKPHPSARSLAGQKSYMIALLYDNPSANYLMEIMSGVLEACEASHYNMMLQPLLYRSSNFLQSVKAWISHSRFDGLVLTPPITDDPALIKWLNESQIPYSSVSPKVKKDCIGVTLDERRAAREIVEHLVSLGHRRIAHIKGHPDHGASGWRLAGYREGLAKAGIPLDPKLVVDGEFSFDSGVTSARQILNLKRPPTAVFAANDDMAAGVISVAYERGLSIPRDISICGFDDTPMSRQISPSLTTIRQPSQDMGRVATFELLKAIRDPQAGEMVRMPFALKLRSSTGAAP
jgi:LacI family transcriptional regulator